MRSEARQIDVRLDDVLVTSELNVRPARFPNLQRENEALKSLADCFAKSPETILNRLVELAISLCGAGTAGISLEQTTPDGELVFLWVALAGELKQMLGGTTPRNFSPCGVCVDKNAPQLFYGLDRFYTYFQKAPLPFMEALLIPWRIEGGPVGTIWIVAHSDRSRFDLEDVRVMKSLADFAAVALRHQDAEQKLRESERNAATAELAASLAHQINNPLQAITNALTVVNQQNGLTEEGRQFIALAQQEIQKVGKLTHEIMSLEDTKALRQRT